MTSIRESPPELTRPRPGGKKPSLLREAACALDAANGVVFIAALLAYMLLLLAEELWNASISFFFDLNVLAFILLVSGVFYALSARDTDSPRPTQRNKLNVVYLVALSLAVAFATFNRSAAAGIGRYLVALGVSALLLLVASVLIDGERL